MTEDPSASASAPASVDAVAGASPGLLVQGVRIIRNRMSRENRSPPAERRQTDAAPIVRRTAGARPWSFPGRRAWITPLLAIGLAACASSADFDPTSNWTADQLYADARQALDAGTWNQAVKSLQRLESRFPFGRYAQQAQLDLAWALYKEGERAEALSNVDRFIRLHPAHERLDYAFYLKGVINFNTREGLVARFAGQDMSERDLNATREAYEAFRQVVTRFPESRYAPDSLDRMKFLVNTMASGEVSIARFYFTRGAYVAAVNRSLDVIANYRDTPALEEALAVMANSYDRLGMRDLRDDTWRILERSFPESRWLAQRAK
jgi:outer membrane protein assembly factor BamD